ncbi:MAG: glycosyltransferase family 2 protein [Acidobacteriia bacterium]|nr:glycosyltransferase family 2 protein [Terriglobia bacterium]
MIAALFWSSLALIAYVYAIYPLLIAAAAKAKPRRAVPEIPGDAWPGLAVLIPACNEERWIARKIENTLALDYPPEKLRVVVASDGSSDRTDEIAQEYAARGVERIQFPSRLGKQEVLNRVIPQLREEVVLLTDASALLEPAAARRLARHFADPRTGCVAGRRVCALQRRSAPSLGESLYWRYESWIKSSESRVHSATCADGQIYAVRRAAVSRVHTGGEDFVIPMAMVARGFRFLFEPEAVAVVPAASALASEFRRKVRSHVAFLLNAWLMRRLLIPRRSPVWWQLLSHHVLRMLVPPAMLLAFLAAAPLAASGPFYRALFFAQAAFYGLAAAGSLLAQIGLRPKIFYVPFYFVFAQLALAAAWWGWARGQREFVWQRTERLPDAS